MIVITGPGRSGTSFLASLYKELGFDPGGEWVPSINAGLEDHAFRQVNTEIACRLRVSLVIPIQRGLPVTKMVRKKVPPVLLRPAQAARQAILRRVARPRPIDWERFEGVVDRYGEQLRMLSRTKAVVKDPRFCWTLPVWVAAGAEVEHLTMSLRATDAVVASRRAAGHTRAFSDSAARNSILYGIGTCLATVVDAGVPHSIVEYPRYLNDPEGLYAALRFPLPVPWPRFAEAFDSLRRSPRP